MSLRAMRALSSAWHAVWALRKNLMGGRVDRLESSFYDEYRFFEELIFDVDKFLSSYR